MSEFYIVSAGPHEEHKTIEAARLERDNLIRHIDKPFRIYRCKDSLQGAKHFPKMVALLQDIVKDGLTQEARARAQVLLTTVHNRSPHITVRPGLPWAP